MCKHLLLISLPFHDLSSINDTCMNQLFHCGLQNCYFLILSLFLYQLAFLFLLQYSCFTVLCQFLLCSKVNQLYVYIYPLFLRFSCHLGHRRALTRVPCAIQQVLISYLFICSSVYTSVSISRLIPPPHSALVSISLFSPSVSRFLLGK